MTVKRSTDVASTPGSVMLPTDAPSQLYEDEAIAFRVRIGVTGHRCIADPEEVTAAVEDGLQRACAMLPTPTQFTPVVFSLLSALAEGADRLVAKVALNSDLAVELGAILPLALNDYLKDFPKYKSRCEFRDLHHRAAASVELEQESVPVGHGRDAAYNRGGRYIVDRSDLLIAVWDGREPQGCGGTADIVKYARQQEVPVLVIPARSCQGEEVDPRLEVVDFRRKSRRLRAINDAFCRLDSFNRMSLSSSKTRRTTGLERFRLGRALEDTSLYDQYLRVADWGLPHLARADKQAVIKHRCHRVLTWAVHLLAALAVADVAVQALFFFEEPLLLIGEVVFVLLLLLAVATLRFMRLHDRWIGYRSLAEAFRSAMFLALSGTDDQQRETSAGILGEPAEPWFQRAFSQAWRSCPRGTPGSETVSPLCSFLIEGWIDDQISYHQEVADRSRALQNLCTWIMAILVLATVVVALLHITQVSSNYGTLKALTLAALVLPAFGGAVAGLREYAQIRPREERSKRAVVRLRSVKDRLTASATLESVRRLAAEAHRVMDDENLDWYGVVEFQEVNLVI